MESIWKRWKQGMKDMTPRQILSAKLIGLRGTIIGILIGGTWLAISGAWAFLVLLFFMIFLQVVEYISTKKQYDQIVQIENSIEMAKVDKLMRGEYNEVRQEKPGA